MLTCSHCSDRFPNVNALIIHLRKSCTSLPTKFSSGDGYRCGQGCYGTFDSLNTLRTHLNRIHISSKASNSNHKTTQTVSEQSLPAPDQNSGNIIEHNSELQIQYLNCANLETDRDVTYFVHAESSTKDILTTETALLISSLLADPLVPRKTVQLFVKSMSSYINDTMTLALQSWYSKVLQEQECMRCKPNVKELMLTVMESVRNLSSEYKMNKYFTDLGTYIKPEKYLTATEPRDVFIGSIRNQTISTGQFIPLRFVLHRFLSIPGILKSIDEYIEYCLRSKVVINIVRTSIWLNKIKSLKSNEKLLPLLVYYDDYETGNPLGSHAGVHKLGAVYASIACLPPNLASQLKYIFLFSLFHVKDRTQNEGNFNCFHKVIDELNFLSSTGINLNIAGYYHGTIKFQLVSLLGDNLGLHSILGFVESFSANYPCRVCRTHKEIIRYMCVENVSSLRNETNYKADLKLNNPTKTGIKEEAVWKQVNGFDIFKQVGMDIMHDILEGVARYTMKEVLRGLLLKNYFTLEELNNRVVAFNYGPDSDCKPPQLISVNKGTVKWKMSAMETFNFIKYFSCFVSHKVSDDDEHWELYLLLRKISDISMTEAVYPEICDEMRDTVTDFNKLYILLSDSHLKPKYHHLIHYPGVMEKLGPLCNLWSMRYESKHRVSKICARASCNRINLPKTLAIKNQYQLNYLFLKNKIDLIIEPSLWRKDLDSEKFKILSRQFNLSSESKVFVVKFISLNGIRYESKQVLALDINENSGEPDFIEITEIYYSDNKEVFFGGISLENEFFDPHVNAYCVKKNNIVKYVSYDSIAFVKPNHLTKLPPHGWWYVTIRNSFY